MKHLALWILVSSLGVITAANCTYRVNSAQAEVIRPRTGSQLYVQRVATLQAGQWHSRIAPSAFAERWQVPWQSPTYQQWQSLLTHEAAVMASRQGQSPLTVLVGDSIYLWLPQEYLPGDRLWLNQSISGETTAQLVGRLNYFVLARPYTIYVMAGVNDLKQGTEPRVVVSNMELMAQRLRRQHPQARVIVLSILPTRLPNIPPQRVRQVNQQLAIALPRRQVEFLDVQLAFMDSQGLLRADLTTDGLHLSPQGYRLLSTYLR